MQVCTALVACECRHTKRLDGKAAARALRQIFCNPVGHIYIWQNARRDCRPMFSCSIHIHSQIYTMCYQSFGGRYILTRMTSVRRASRKEQYLIRSNNVTRPGS